MAESGRFYAYQKRQSSVINYYHEFSIPESECCVLVAKYSYVSIIIFVWNLPDNWCWALEFRGRTLRCLTTSRRDFKLVRAPNYLSFRKYRRLQCFEKSLICFGVKQILIINYSLLVSIVSYRQYTNELFYENQVRINAIVLIDINRIETSFFTYKRTVIYHLI